MKQETAEETGTALIHPLRLCVLLFQHLRQPTLESPDT